MANKKINELDSRASLSLSDLMAVGDPSTGYLYKTTISDLKTLTGAGVISFNGRFGAVSPAEGDYSLTQLSDVIITTAANGNIIKYNGSNWVNVPMYTGTIAQYVDGTGAYQTFPTLLSSDRLITEVRNNTGATVTKGTVVYLNGSSGTLPTIAKAQANSEATSSSTYGVVQNDIANNANGYVVVIGNLTGLDTSAYTAGDILWLSPTTAGGVTTTKPVAPNNAVYVGIVTRSNNSAGTIEVKIQNGYELDELHNVLITSVANNDGLFWDSATSLWKNKSISTVLGYTPQAQLNGTGFVKASGTTITYDNSTYVTTNTSQTISGVKIFSSPIYADEIVLSAAGTASQTFLKNLSTAGTVSTGANLLGFNTDDNFYLASDGKGYAVFSFNNSGTGYTYTLPALSGTVALTSNLSSYLPLSGGTLTGALSGTSASFSSTVQASAYRLTGMTAGSGALYWSSDKVTLANYNASGVVHIEANGGTGVATFGGATYNNDFVGTGRFTGTLSGTSISLNSTGDDGIFVDHGGSRGIRINSYSAGYGLVINNASGSTSYPLAILSEGANKILVNADGTSEFNAAMTLNAALSGTSATFSSNVTAVTQGASNGFNTGGLIAKSNGNTAKYTQVGYDNSGNYGWIQAIEQGTAYTNLVLNGAGGNVGIGTTAPALPLEIFRSAGTACYVSTSVGSSQFLSGVDSGGLARLYTGGAIDISFWTAATERARITSGGFVLIGTSTYGGVGVSFDKIGASIFNYSGTGSLVLVEFKNDNGTIGTIVGNGSSTTYNTSSDYRLKQDLKDFNGLNLVSAIKTYDYQWKSNKSRMYGVMAHELQEVIPYAVVGEKDGEQMQGVDYSKIVPVLVKGLQEEDAKVNAQELRIQQLESQIEELKAIINK